MKKLTAKIDEQLIDGVVPKKVDNVTYWIPKGTTVIDLNRAKDNVEFVKTSNESLFKVNMDLGKYYAKVKSAFNNSNKAFSLWLKKVDEAGHLPMTSENFRADSIYLSQYAVKGILVAGKNVSIFTWRREFASYKSSPRTVKKAYNAWLSETDKKGNPLSDKALQAITDKAKVERDKAKKKAENDLIEKYTADMDVSKHPLSDMTDEQVIKEYRKISSQVNMRIETAKNDKGRSFIDDIEKVHKVTSRYLQGNFEE